MRVLDALLMVGEVDAALFARFLSIFLDSTVEMDETVEKLKKVLPVSTEELITAQLAPFTDPVQGDSNGSRRGAYQDEDL